LPVAELRRSAGCTARLHYNRLVRVQVEPRPTAECGEASTDVSADGTSSFRRHPTAQQVLFGGMRVGVEARGSKLVSVGGRRRLLGSGKVF